MADAPTLESLAAVDSHRVLFNLPRSETEFAAIVGRPGFRRAMICQQGDKAIGAAATSMRDQRSLNLRLTAFFEQPENGTLPLAAYVRHLFWSAPLHRIYVQLPAVAGADAYIQLLTSVAFQEEGVVRDHGLLDGRPCDVVSLGLLRREFEDWATQNQPTLEL